jgi:hypothetical protein
MQTTNNDEKNIEGIGPGKIGSKKI